MRYLSTDPALPALQEWSMRNHEAIEPVRAVPESGQLLLSRLSVLTPGQVRAVLADGVELVTCDGLDMRRSTGCGDIAAGVLRVVVGALDGWAVPSGLPAVDMAEIERLRADNARLVEQVVEMQARFGEERADRTEDLREAQQLLGCIVARHFTGDPDFQIGSSMRFVLSQISNAVSGLERSEPATLGMQNTQSGDPAILVTFQDDGTLPAVPGSGGASGNVSVGDAVIACAEALGITSTDPAVITETVNVGLEALASPVPRPVPPIVLPSIALPYITVATALPAKKARGKAAKAQKAG